MKFLGGTHIPNVNGQWSFILPLLTTTFWWAMLIALLVCWAIQGQPVYTTGDSPGTLLYISNIGATNLQGIFIAGATLQGIFSVWTFIQENNLRTKEYLHPFNTIHARNLQIASIVFALIGAIGIFLVSCLKDTKFDRVHISFVCVFIAGEFLHCIMNMAAQGEYRKKYEDIRKYCVTMIVIKSIWLVIGLGWVIGYGAASSDTASAVCEWGISFWYGFWPILISIDFRQKYLGESAEKHSHSPSHPMNQPDLHASDNSTIV